MTTAEKWECGVLVALAIILLWLMKRNGVIGIPQALTLPTVTLGNADPTVSAMPPGPLGDAPFAAPGNFFTGQYACGCGTR